LGRHGAAKTSGLDLRTREGVLAGGENGPVIAPSDVENSKLFQLVTHELKPTMPPGKKLSDADIDVLRRWIEAGGPFDGFEKTAAAASDRTEGGDSKKLAELAKLEERPITPEERRYWAFQAPKRSATPLVERLASGSGQARWAKNPIDAFLLAAMKSKGLKPSPPADRRTLIRRAYLDLLGLPPTKTGNPSMSCMPRSFICWDSITRS
jgi:hypothetical protein